MNGQAILKTPLIGFESKVDRSLEIIPLKGEKRNIVTNDETTLK